MIEKRNVRTGDRLVLGFDGGCFTCRDLAQRIEERIGDKIEVLNLVDAQMEQWRSQVFGENAPWAPTLVEIKNNKVSAWTGVRMGIHLSRVLGPVATWRVMQALGEIGPAIVPDDSLTSRAVVGMSRGQFLKGLGGAAVAMSALSGTGVLASVAEAQGPPSDSRGKRLARALRRMSPYVEFQDDRMLSIDVRSARKAGINKWSIQVAVNMVELNNKIITNYNSGESLTISSPEIESLQQKFKPMFTEVAKGQNETAYDAQASTEGTFTAQALACGGNRNNPHRCPRYRYSGRYFTTRRRLAAHLSYLGYGETPGPASGYAPADFTKVIYAYNCGFGPFRAQAYGFRTGGPNNSVWSYWVQSPEPNPVLAYRWPTWWWGGYVRWWHREYC